MTKLQRKLPLDHDGSRGAKAKFALICAALEEFGENSIDGASTRRIAERAGQNIAAITYYFEGKQGLYFAVAEYVSWLMIERSKALLDEIDAFLDSGRDSPQQCLTYLRSFFRSVIQREYLEGRELIQFIVREQTHPTDAFQILFENAFQRFHKSGTRLLARYTNHDPECRKTIMHFHALLGEALNFRMTRETLERRLSEHNSPHTTDDDIVSIEEIVIEHVEFVARGLRLKESKSRK
jgi:AcrR family transcriptional regulator